MIDDRKRAAWSAFKVALRELAAVSAEDAIRRLEDESVNLRHLARRLRSLEPSGPSLLKTSRAVPESSESGGELNPEQIACFD